MGLVSVTVEANGWVLAVTGSWSATPGVWEYSGEDRTNGRFLDGGTDQFPLDPDGTPKIMLTVTRQGFTRSGGQAVASSGDTQVVVATKPLRKPYPNQSQLDETDLGGGQRTIRFALSQRIYAGDSVSVATFAAGWKAGQGAASVGTVTNSSARALPVAISRWAQPGFTLVRGTTLVDVDVIVAAPFPRHFGATWNQALAAMKLTATDGTTTKTFWITTDRVSPQYGDNLLCWGGQIDLSGLTAGPVTIHREEFPWVGASRSTGSGQSTDTTNGNPTAWAAPLVICYDPASTLYPCRHVFVDPATGTTTAASVTVGTTLAAAKAGTRAADISTAVQALYLANFSLPARNGWAADTARAMDWNVITLSAGVRSWGATSVTSGANCNEGRLVIQGDPDDADPKANCIWRTGSAAITKQVARFWLQNLTVEGGEATLGGGLWHADNVIVRGKPGFESATTGIFSGTSASGYAILSLTRTLWWRYGASFQGTNTRCLIARNCQHSRNGEAVVHITSSKPADSLFTTRDVMAFGTWGLTSIANSDAMVWGCRALDWAGRFISVDGSRSGGAGNQASPNTFTRFACVNSLCERSKGNSGERMWGIGESAYDQMQDFIFEGLTLTGNGWNAGYNGSPSPFANLQHTGVVMRNCVHSRTATKHDVFKTDGSLTGSWEYLYGVGFEGNVHGNRNAATASNFQFAWFGLGAAVDNSFDGYGLDDFLLFTDDNSDHGPEAPTGTGNGDYRLATGSPALGRAKVASAGVDMEGAFRGASFSAGAIGGAFAVASVLQPAVAQHPHVATASAVAGRVGVVAAGNLHAVTGTAAIEVIGKHQAQAPSGRTLRVGGDVRALRADGV